MFMHDLRVALRSLLRTPGYATLALITLVLGIGANSTVFSLISSVLLEPLPYPEPDRLVRISEVSGKGTEMQVAWQNFSDWRARARQFEHLAAHYAGGEATVMAGGQPLRVTVTSVSAGFFDALGPAPLIGRFTRADDHRRGAAPVAVVSHSFWQAHLGAPTNLDSIALVADGSAVQVVGVMPASFSYPGNTAIWAALELDEQSDSRTSHNFIVIGRLNRESSLQAADAELDAITRGFLTADPGAANQEGFEDYFPREARVVTLHEALVGSARQPLLVLLGAATLVLLLACTNLASTTLARATTRERDFAVRHALGGSFARVVSSMFAETLLIAGAGCVLALALAAGVLRGLTRILPAGMPRVEGVQLDARVVLFTAGVSIVAALLAGLWPALRLSSSAMQSLRGARGTESPHRQRVWKLLIGTEVAFALLLLIGAGLLLRSFATILSVEPGFTTAGVLTATVDPPSGQYRTMQQRRDYYQRLRTALAAVPGVQHAGLVMAAPMQWIPNGLIEIDNGSKPTLSAEYQLADADYFRALDIPLVRGRMLASTDRDNTEQVVVVNRALADAAWPGENPVGKRITAGGMDDHWETRTWATVVGVVGNIRQRDLTREARPAFYFAYTQRPFRSWSMTAVIRPVKGNPASVTSSVRAAIADLDRNVPVRFATLDQRVGDALSTRRFIMMLVGVFALIALLLASVGVFGVVAYAVARRRREIGIRIALGAEARTVRAQLQRDYLTPIFGGALVGVLAALALTRTMAALLYEIRPADPLTFASVVALLAAVGWLASFVPALRSSRADPLETMRAE
ncbi:MAG: ABC transporter permease [Gemmatimonadota bacterium]